MQASGRLRYAVIAVALGLIVGGAARGAAGGPEKQSALPAVPQVAKALTTPPLDFNWADQSGLDAEWYFRRSPDGRHGILTIVGSGSTLLRQGSMPVWFSPLHDIQLTPLLNLLSWGPNGELICTKQGSELFRLPASDVENGLAAAYWREVPGDECLAASVPGTHQLLIWASSRRQLWLLGMSDGRETKVGDLGDGPKVSWMDVSPSGSLVALAFDSPKGTPYGTGNIAVFMLDGLTKVGEATALTRCHWHPTRDALVYERSGDVWELAVPDWRPRKLRESARQAAVSPDGRWLAYMAGEDEQGVFVAAYGDLNGGPKLVEDGADPFWWDGSTLTVKRVIRSEEKLDTGITESFAFTNLELRFSSAAEALGIGSQGTAGSKGQRTPGPASTGAPPDSSRDLPSH